MNVTKLLSGFLVLTTFGFVSCVVEESNPAPTSTTTNNTTQTTSGNSLSLSFDGTNDFVEIADHSSLDLTTSYTLEAWIKIDKGTSLAGIISKYQTSGSAGYMLRLSNTAPYDEINFDGKYTSGLNLEENTWYHIAATHNNGTKRLYVNGMEEPLIGQADFENPSANSDPLRIGVDYSNRHFWGDIDEVRIWKTARTQSQINDNKSKTLSSSENGLVAYYQFRSDATASGNNEDFNVVDDFSNNNNKGTLINFTLSGSLSNWASNYTTSSEPDPDPVSYNVGDDFGGGVIAYVDGTGQHGLITTSTDYATLLPFSNGNDVDLNCSQSYGAGESNTDKIIAHHGNGTYAAKVCKDLVRSGFSDWYLPSEGEVQKLYENRLAIGGFSGGAYWTSSERNSNATGEYAVGISFQATGVNAGQSYIYYKSQAKLFRPVRSF